MKKINTLVGLLLLSLGAFAQGTTETALTGSTTSQNSIIPAQQNFYIMPYIGIGSQKSYNADFYNDPSIKLSALAGITSGVSVFDSVGSHLMLGFGISYSSYSTIGEYHKTSGEGGEMVGTYYDSYGYLTIPLSMTLKSGYAKVNRTRFGFYGQFQLSPSYNISATQKQTLSGSALTLNNTPCTMTNIRNEVKPLNLMLGFSGGITIPMYSGMIFQFGPYYNVALVDSKKAPYLYYNTVSGTSESYTPTIMKAVGAQISLAFRIGSKTKGLINSSTSAAK